MINLTEFNFDDYLSKIQVQTQSNHVYECEKCNDTGFEVLQDGVRACKCQIKDAKKHALNFCFETDAKVFLSAERIANKTHKLTPQQIAALKFAHDFYTGTTNKATYFHSAKPGTGKTAILSYLGVRVSQERNLRTQFLSVVRLKELFLSCIDESKPIESVLNLLKYNIDFLILDDLGSEKISEFYEENFYNLIDYRYNAEKLTAFTSNYTIDSLPYNPRIRSRIHGLATEFELLGKDFRRDR